MPQVISKKNSMKSQSMFIKNKINNIENNQMLIIMILVYNQFKILNNKKFKIKMKIKHQIKINNKIIKHKKKSI